MGVMNRLKEGMIVVLFLIVSKGFSVVLSNYRKAKLYTREKISMNRELKRGRIGVVTIVMILVLTMMGCAGQAVKKSLPVSSWGEKYFYKYEPPGILPPGSVKITLAIVSPYFGGTKLDPVYSKVAQGLGRSMAIDLDKIIITKGMTVTGPFETLELMTYPDKKNADLSLTPEFLINTQEKEINQWKAEGGYLTKTIELKIDGWVVLILREPLSSEKIWIKKIEIGEKTEQTKIYAEKVLVGQKPGVVTIPLPLPWQMYQAGEIVYDGRPDAVANMVKEMYPQIMQTTYNYLDTNEILILKEKAEEIRKLKRY